MLGDRFNADGDNCPRCFATRALTPVVPRYEGVAKFDCVKCYARFRFEEATDQQLATLVQIPFEVPDTRCTCGARIGAFQARCRPCASAEQYDAQRAGR